MMATALVYPNKTLEVWGEYSLSFIDFNLKANKMYFLVVKGYLL